MKRNVTQAINDMSGKPISDKPEEAMLRRICLEVLMNTLRGDDNMPGAEKARLYALGMKIQAEAEPDLPVEDWTLIKDRIGKAYGPLVVGQAYAMIDSTTDHTILG